MISQCLKDGRRVRIAVLIEHKSQPDAGMMDQLLMYVRGQAELVLPPIVMADVWEADEDTLVKWARQSAPLPDQVRMEMFEGIVKYFRRLHPQIEMGKIIETVQCRVR